MITKEQFHQFYHSLNLDEIDAEEFLYTCFCDVMNTLLLHTNNSPAVHEKENIILDYVMQEYLYALSGKNREVVQKNIQDIRYKNEFVQIVADKVFFNEITPYHPLAFISHQSPIISTMELNINFILNQITSIQEKYKKKDILLDMFTKVFLMFKSVNYLLSQGFETEAFSTWRTIHELECVIKVIHTDSYVIPTYLRHIVYNTAFRNEFDDKDEQQKTIDELKVHMKKQGLKSKDMKKFIEYGWMYEIKDLLTRVPGFKLNFRNGLESLAGLADYSEDYEMSSEVAHSSPLLIYSNKIFFCDITVVRSYESFLRLESIFFEQIQEYKEVDTEAYIKMRNLYVEFSKRILTIERTKLNRLITKTREAKNKKSS